MPVREHLPCDERPWISSRQEKIKVLSCSRSPRFQRTFFFVLMVACVWVRFCLSWDSKKLCCVFTHNEIGIIETPTLDDPFGHSNLNTNTKPDFYLRRIVLVDLPFAFNETLLTSLVIPVYR